MKQTLLFLMLAMFTLTTNVLQAQTPIGKWKTVDDETGETKSIVEIYERSGKLYGKVIDLLLKPDDTVCQACTGSRKNQRVVGMVIMADLAPYRDYWKSGTIFDPETDSTYGCSIWFENGNTNELKVRGKHWTGLYRTQTWYRAK